MPANEKKTDIRLMRGSTNSSENWVPNPGEPLIDMESMTLNFGDGITVGGIPINTVTCHILDGEKDLDTLVTYGRFFINEFLHGPTGVSTTARIFLTVQAADTKTEEIWQSVQIIDGEFSGYTFIRVSLDGGFTWNIWKNISSGFNFIIGIDNNLNNYINTTSAVVTNMVNAPIAAIGDDGMLLVYTPEYDSTNVYQTLYVYTGPCEGKIYFRYSKTKNLNFDTPGYDWRELTDFAHTNLQNATGILSILYGGTGRNDGTVFQSDVAIKLKTPRTLSTTGAAIGTETVFDGSSNISIPITGLNASSLNSGVVPVSRLSGSYNIDISGSARRANLADLAEYYKADCELIPGDVVVISTNENYDISKATKSNHNFIGIVSTDPGFVLNSQKENKHGYYPIARIGKVPCFVIGTVNKGDKLTITFGGCLIKSDNSNDIHCAYANQSKLTKEKDIIEVII